MKVVINERFGGFGISDEGYEWLIKQGVPVKKYTEQKRDPKTMLYLPEPANDGEVIFDRELEPATELNKSMRRMCGRYWENWITRENRTHPLLVRMVEELGREADGPFAQLKIIEVPDDVTWKIDEYDGNESIEEVHRSWC